MNSEMLSISVRDLGGVRVMKLTGDLDSFTSKRLSNAAGAWASECVKLLINLDGLKYIDSSGLSALVAISVHAEEQGVPMVISCRNPRIFRVFEITGLDKYFNTEGVLPESVLNIGASMSIAGIGLTDEIVRKPVDSASQPRSIRT